MGSGQVASNIAEGEGRGRDAEFVQLLRIDHGSLREVETQLMFAERLKYLNKDELHALIELASEVGRLITGLRNSLESK